MLYVADTKWYIYVPFLFCHTSTSINVLFRIVLSTDIPTTYIIDLYPYNASILIQSA